MGLSPGQSATKAWLGFAGQCPRQVAAGAAWTWLGFAGQVAAGAAGAWLGFAGLGPGQVAVRGGSAGRAGQVGFAGLGARQVGQPGLGLALLGWVLGRAGQTEARLGFAGLGPRQVEQSRAARACLGLAVAWQGRLAGVKGRLGQLVQVGQGLGRPGLSLALLGWVLGRWQSGAGWQAGQGMWGRQGQTGIGLALLGWVLGRWQSGVGRQGRAGQAGRAGQTGACLGFAGLSPRQPGLLRMGRLGRWGRSVGKGRADWLVIGFSQAGQAGAWLGFAGLGPGQVRQVGRQAGLAGQLCWADGVGRGSRGLARLYWAGAGHVGWAGAARAGSWAGDSQGAAGVAGAAGARLGFAGLGPWQVGQA
ncbi:hypothetical protein PPACK8108_LOCUS23940 [Phakopsora pachyrhizi]|uniref:Uncharacterized protein n=1 Tax=Phakopsora pachyrhizi TaxID=170000 RepID=A0AAV0BRA8_PHAPC|nr:hypothetical protein PPACK8108_LOCUS23940 [Phakopsora pachyrhizi]